VQADARAWAPRLRAALAAAAGLLLVLLLQGGAVQVPRLPVAVQRDAAAPEGQPAAAGRVAAGWVAGDWGEA
jgi:hypothetical protein